MKKPNLKIFVAHHKPWLIHEDEIFVPIHVWKENSKYDLWILGDNTWDNISDKNSWFCELTAQYRVWKNYDLSDVDYVWFCHYRRYMTYNYTPKPFTPFNAFKKDSNLYRSIIYFFYYLFWIEYETKISESALKDISHRTQKFITSNDSDIILPRRWIVRRPYHKLAIENEKAWKIMDDIFAKKFPEYYETFKKMDNNLLCSFGNIFIMKKELFFEYEKFQFWLLLEFEKELKKQWMENDAIANWNRWINTRVMWFISERFPCLFANYRKHKWKKINYDPSLLFFY